MAKKKNQQPENELPNEERVRGDASAPPPSVDVENKSGIDVENKSGKSGGSTNGA